MNDRTFFLPRRLLASGYVRIVILPGLFLALSWGAAGCRTTDPTRGYTSAGLYRTDIETVYVPIFESELFQREVEYELTRLICRYIELHSPYKVVSDRTRADTMLYGRLTRLRERVMNQQRQLDRPLENQVVLTATVNWKDLRSGEMLINAKTYRLSGDYALLLGAGRTSAIRSAANEMALRIVEDMENRGK